MTCCIALLRGINVGKAKRIAMADLRALMEKLGFTEVRTLLNSGNVVFQASRPNPRKIAVALESAIEQHCGFHATVVVLTATTLDLIITENALLPEASREPSRFLVAFALEATPLLKKIEPLAGRPWKPEALCVGSTAAYLWCANGILESKLLQAFMPAASGLVTTRNWATVLKLQAMTRADAKAR